MPVFEIQLEQFHDKVNERLDFILRKVSFDLLRAVVLLTPVDTGRARASWGLGIDSPSADMVGEVAKLSKEAASRMAFNNAQRVVEEVMFGDSVFITNPVEYIVFLEGGSSKQAPQGMVKKSLRRFPSIVEKAIQESKRSIP